jgi:Spy/CpxP family protein refolding chaperone
MASQIAGPVSETSVGLPFAPSQLTANIRCSASSAARQILHGLLGRLLQPAVLYMKDKMMMPPGPRPPTREVVEDMAARYDLTPEQARKVEAAVGKRREALQTLFEQFRTKSEAEFQALSSDIRKILTPEQYERWERDFKQRRRPGPSWEHGPGRPDDMGPGHRGPGRGFDNRGPGGGSEESGGTEPMGPGPQEHAEQIPGPDSPDCKWAKLKQR